MNQKPERPSVPPPPSVPDVASDHHSMSTSTHHDQDLTRLQQTCQELQRCVDSLMNLLHLAGWRQRDIDDATTGLAQLQAGWRTLDAHRQRVVNLVLAEPELPGPMPVETWDAMKTAAATPESAAEFCRGLVRSAKQSIATAIRQDLARHG